MLGILVGSMLPLPVRPVESPSVPLRATAAREPPACPPPSLGPDLEVVEEALALEQRSLEARWGSPMQAPEVIPEDYRPENLRQRLLTEIPGARWAEVDCAAWPCIGVVVYEQRGISPEDLAHRVGGTRVSSVVMRGAGDGLELLGIGFVERELDRAQMWWLKRLFDRAHIRFMPEIRLVVEGVELAEP